MVSAPPLPVTVSSPAPALMVSALVVPMKVSLPSKLVAETFRAAVPPVKALASMLMSLVMALPVVLVTSTVPSLPLKLSLSLTVKAALALIASCSTLLIVAPVVVRS